VSRGTQGSCGIRLWRCQSWCEYLPALPWFARALIAERVYADFAVISFFWPWVEHAAALVSGHYVLAIHVRHDSQVHHSTRGGGRAARRRPAALMRPPRAAGRPPCGSTRCGVWREEGVGDFVVVAAKKEVSGLCVSAFSQSCGARFPPLCANQPQPRRTRVGRTRIRT
jgi:hypothetical protein